MVKCGSTWVQVFKSEKWINLCGCHVMISEPICTSLKMLQQISKQMFGKKRVSGHSNCNSITQTLLETCHITPLLSNSNILLWRFVFFWYTLPPTIQLGSAVHGQWRDFCIFSSRQHTNEFEMRKVLTFTFNSRGLTKILHLTVYTVKMN